MANPETVVTFTTWDPSILTSRSISGSYQIGPVYDNPEWCKANMEHFTLAELM